MTAKDAGRRKKGGIMKLNLGNIIKKPYYYVPRCPSCGSRATGRFVKAGRGQDPDWMQMEGLRNGELIMPASEKFQKNLFCNDCGHTWHGDVELVMAPLPRITMEKEARGTEPLRQDMLQKQRDERGKKGVISKFLGF